MLSRFWPIFVLVKHNVDDDVFHRFEDVEDDWDHNQLDHIEDDELNQVLLDRVYPKYSQRTENLEVFD